MDPSDIIAGIAVLISLFALWRTEQTRRNAVKVAWDRARDCRRTFWPIIRHAYQRFLSTNSEGYPKDLEQLISVAGIPPNVPVPKATQIKDWYKTSHKSLSERQSQIWEFATKVYPRRNSDITDVLERSIVKTEDRDEFDNSRRCLANFFLRQREVSSNRRLAKVVPHVYRDVALLAWLELALVRAVGDEGPESAGYQGKKGLYQYAVYLHKRHAR